MIRAKLGFSPSSHHEEQKGSLDWPSDCSPHPSPERFLPLGAFILFRRTARSARKRHAVLARHLMEVQGFC